VEQGEDQQKTMFEHLFLWISRAYNYPRQGEQGEGLIHNTLILKNKNAISSSLSF
jgi:hypothetical protein